jgi:hypothetical protein
MRGTTTEVAIPTLATVPTEWGPLPRRLTITTNGAGGDPDMTAEVEVRDGRPELVSLTFKASKDRGLRTADLSRINVDRMVRTAYEQVGVLFRRQFGATADRARKRRPGRPSKLADPGFLAEVERVYREADRAPVQAVKEAFGVSRRQASTYVAAMKPWASEQGREV